MKIVNLDQFACHFVTGGNNPDESRAYQSSQKLIAETIQQLWVGAGVSSGSLLNSSDNAVLGLICINAHASFNTNPSNGEPLHTICPKEAPTNLQERIETEEFISSLRDQVASNCTLLVLLNSCLGGLIKPVEGVTIITSDSSRQERDTLTNYQLLPLVSILVANKIAENAESITVSEMVESLRTRVPVDHVTKEHPVPQLIGGDLKIKLNVSSTSRQLVCNHLPANLLDLFQKVTTALFEIEEKDEKKAQMNSSLFLVALSRLYELDPKSAKRFASFVNKFWLAPTERKLCIADICNSPKNTFAQTLKMVSQQLCLEYEGLISLEDVCKQVVDLCNEQPEPLMLKLKLSKTLWRNKPSFVMRNLKTAKFLFLFSPSTPSLYWKEEMA